MPRIAFYKTANGEIVNIKGYPFDVAPAEIIADTPVACDALEIDDSDGAPDVTPEEHYVVTLAFVDRPELYPEPTAIVAANGGLGVDALLGILEFAMPTGTVVESEYHGTKQTSGAENFTFKTLRVGVFNFTFTPPFPAQALQLEVTSYAL